MLQAITTKFICPTNTRGARVKASCQRGSLSVEWEDALNAEENHAAAQKMLVEKFAKEDEKEHGPWKGQGVNPWLRPTAHGALEDGRHVFVFTGESNAEESLVYALQNCREVLLKLAQTARIKGDKETENYAGNGALCAQNAIANKGII